MQSDLIDSVPGPPLAEPTEAPHGPTAEEVIFAVTLTCIVSALMPSDIASLPISRVPSSRRVLEGLTDTSGLKGLGYDRRQNRRAIVFLLHSICLAYNISCANVQNSCSIIGPSSEGFHDHQDRS